MLALGFIETMGFVAAVEAADSALKAASVSLVGQKRAGSGLVTVIISGNVAAVKAAVDAGSESASAVGKVISSEVIASPHADMKDVIEKDFMIKDKGPKRDSNTKPPAAVKKPAQQKKRSPGV